MMRSIYLLSAIVALLGGSVAASTCTSTSPVAPAYITSTATLAADKSRITNCINAQASALSGTVPTILFPGDTNYDLRRRGDQYYSAW